MPFTKAALIAEVPPGKGKEVTLNGIKVGLFNVNGAIHAINDTCTHRGGPLSEGPLTGTEVACPWHGARFDVTTGAALSPPARTGVACYRVQIVGDEIQVDMP